MITDILEMSEPTKLQAQVIVMGSGIGGSEVATYLAPHGRERTPLPLQFWHSPAALVSICWR